jgi:hypothetical protein
MAAVVLTQHPLTAFFRNQHGYAAQFALGWREFVEGLANGARNMTAVGIATATAGILVGMVTLTGIGLVMTEIVEFLSGGSIVIMLVLVGAICIILGSGLPTTASYVVVATLMAPVVVELAAENDLAVPLIAVHMFVFYFGLMADVSPPVGLAAYAAAAIAGADPMKVGWQGTWYELRTLLLPFIFIFNPEFLLLDIGGPLHFAVVVGSGVLAMMAFVRGAAGLLLRAQSLVGDDRAAADLLHAVPSAFLDGLGGTAVPQRAKRRDYQAHRRYAARWIAALPGRDHGPLRRSDEQDGSDQARRGRRRACASCRNRDRHRLREPADPGLGASGLGGRAAEAPSGRQDRIGQRAERAAEPVLVRDSGAHRVRGSCDDPAAAERNSGARFGGAGDLIPPRCPRLASLITPLFTAPPAGAPDVRNDDSPEACRSPHGSPSRTSCGRNGNSPAMSSRREGRCHAARAEGARRTPASTSSPTARCRGSISCTAFSNSSTASTSRTRSRWASAPTATRRWCRRSFGELR